MKKIQYLWHYIPLIVIAIALLILYVDPWLGIWRLFMVWWLLLPMPIIAIIALIHSFKIGGTHKKAVVVFSGTIVLAFVMFFVVRIPMYRCSPDSMADHYNKKGSKIEELVTFAQSALDDGQTMRLEFEHGKVSMFHTTSKCHWGDADSLRTSLMAEVGLDEDEFQFIKKESGSAFHLAEPDSFVPLWSSMFMTQPLHAYKSKRRHHHSLHFHHYQKKAMLYQNQRFSHFESN